MGLDAFVSCNCYKEGKTTTFPLPELQAFFGLEDGMWELMLPDDDLYMAIFNWKNNGACQHDNMEIVSERLSNWSGYRAFQQALSQIGWQHFPILKAELPEANGGLMPAGSSAKVLQELDYFQKEAKFGTKFSLFDSESGKVIHDYVKAYNGIFILDGTSQLDVGVDPNGFFVQTEQKPPITLFRAKHFEQRLLKTHSDSSQSAKVEFYDLDSETRYHSPVQLTYFIPWPDGRWQNDAGEDNVVFPRIMRVAERTVGAEEYDYIVQPLIRLCNASVETGNPVVWC